MKTNRLTVSAKRVSDDGIIEFIGSTATPDRVGDVVEQSWDLSAYLLNPVVLYAHNHDALPIAKTLEIGVVDGSLRFRAQFVPGDIYPFAGTVRALYERGFLSAFSVGFRPTGEITASGVGFGSRIESSELLEVSAVPVPMNAEALLVERAADAPPIAPVFGKASPATAAARSLAGADAERVKAWFAAPAPEANTAAKAAPEAAPAPAAIDRETEALRAAEAAAAEMRASIEAMRADIAAIAATVKAMQPTAAAPAAAPAAATQSTAETGTDASATDGLDEVNDETAYEAECAALAALILAERTKLNGDKQ